MTIMLNRIIRFSIQHKLVVGIGVLVLLVTGVFALRSLPIDAIPDITNNQVQVFTLSPSLSAPEVERLLTIPIEQQLVSIPGRTEIRSISRFGLSVVTVVFEEDIDVYWARQQVSERLKMAEEQIPNGIGKPELGPVSTGLSEIYQYTVHPEPGFEEKYDPMELRTIQDWYVRRQLLGTKGIADVSSLGGFLKQYEVSITPQRLVSMNVTIDELFSALEQNNQNAGGAYIERNETAYFIRSEGMVNSLDDIRKIPVKQNANGTPMFLGDVADVRFGHAVRYGALTRNGEGEAVGGIVLMLKGANSSEVADRVKERLEEIKKTLPEGVTITAFLDRTKLVDASINTVAKNLIEGALIVIFVLVLLLGNLRAGLVVASVIPLAMLFAVCMMRLFGVSGNLMSLGAIDFGLIVDGAVIIVEATLHHLGTHRKGQLSKAEMNEEVYTSASKIRNAAAFGEIIILIVYLPILALTGIEGKMFRPMAETVVFAILGAFLLSLTYVPMMSALVLNRNIQHKVTFSDRMIAKFQSWYRPIIRWALRHPVKITGSAFAAFGVCVVLFLNMGGEFIPQLDEGDFAVETRAMQGGSLPYSVQIAGKAEKLLLQQFPDEVEQVVGKIGAPEIPTDPMPVEANDMMVILKDRKYWKKADTREELADTMAKALSAIIGVNFGFQQPIQMRFNELMTGARQDVVVKIYGDDLDVLTEYADKLGAIVNTVQGAKDIYVEQVTGLPQIVVKLRRDNIARYGLTVQEINHAVNTAFAGQKAGVVYEGEKQFDLVVRLDSSYRKQISDVSTLNIAAGNRQIPLSEVADVRFINGPAQVQREGARRRIMVGFNVRGRDVESIVQELKQKTAAKIKLPPGYELTYEGQFKNLEEAKDRLAIAVPAALLLIMMLLYFTFRSVKQTLLIFTAIPLAAIGGVLFLLMRGMPFSISAGVGFIALFGVAVLNGIVLIAEFNKLKKEGMNDIMERIETGVMVRLRPVLMTAAVASLGFLPMALSQSGGAEVQRPLATVVIGGLITSTILTLVVLPALYLLIERRSNRKAMLVPLLLLLGFALPAQAQQVYTIEQAADKMLKAHPQMKAAEADIKEAEALKASAWDVGKTSLGLQIGQYNSKATDNGLSVSQAIPFPTHMIAQRKVFNSVAQERVLQQQLTRQELLLQLRQCFVSLQYQYAFRQRIQELDSVYGVLQHAADWRYKSGESTRLEQVNLLTRKQDMVLQLTQSNQEILGLRKTLQWLLGDATLPDISPALPSEEGALSTEKTIAEHPSVKLYEQKTQTAKLEQKKAGQALWPDLTLGLTNQTLIGYQNIDGTEQYYSRSERFTAVQVGVAVPLVWGPQTARVKAARQQVVSSTAKAEAWQRQFESAYDKTLQETESALTALRYYHEQALPNADLISTKAHMAFKAGDIGYLELLQSLDTAYGIYQKYLSALREVRLKQLSLQYLNGSL